MCLGVPGRVRTVEPDDLGMTMGRVDFGGIVKRVCLAYVPEAEPGDWVLVHVGFALSRIDEDEARRTFALLDEMGELAELRATEPPGAVDGAGPRGGGP